VEDYSLEIYWTWTTPEKVVFTDKFAIGNGGIPEGELSEILIKHAATVMAEQIIQTIKEELNRKVNTPIKI
jgi:hypothetical protein